MCFKTVEMNGLQRVFCLQRISVSAGISLKDSCGSQVDGPAESDTH